MESSCHEPQKNRSVKHSPPRSAGPHRDRPDDGGAAFFPDPRDNASANHGGGDLGEMIAQNFLESATSAQESLEEHRNELSNEELGVPYIVDEGPYEYDASATDDELD